MRDLGVHEVLIDSKELSRVHDAHPSGIDAVLDIVGNTTIIDSLSTLKRGACEIGFLGGGGPLKVEPMFQIPSGWRLTTFASALVTGSAEFPMSEIPFQAIVGHVVDGTYKAKPARVLSFDETQEGHRIRKQAPPSARSW